MKNTIKNLPAIIGARLSTRVKYALILAAIFGIALSLRTWLPYDGVFTGDWVRFGGNDPWYNLRLVENLMQHFPDRIAFDTFTLYPDGQSVPFAPFYDWLIGFVAWLVGLGHPSQHTIEIVTAYFPAVLGALVTIPVYFIGKELFNRKVGLLAAALIAVLPGEFLSRSLLGFSDHHAAEVLFSTIAILFLIITLKRAKAAAISFEHIWSRDWRTIRKPLLYALLTGIALGIYLLSWAGGLLLVLIIFLFMVLQYISDYLRGKSTDYLCIIGVPIFLIALIVVVPFLNQLVFWDLYIGALVIAMLTPPVLSGVCWLMDYRGIKRAYYPLALAGLGLVGVLGFWVIDPSLFHAMWDKFSLFTPGAQAETIAEVRGLFSVDRGMWLNFTTSFILALMAMALITYSTIRERSAEKVLLLVWTLVMLIATLGQVRFSYYFAVNAALLSGYLCWKIPGWVSAIVSWIGFREPRIERRRRPRARERRTELRTEPRTESRVEWRGFYSKLLRPKYVSLALAVIIVFFLAFYPNIGFYPFYRSIGQSMETAQWTSGPGEDWHSSLLWLRDNSPDPFQDPDFYYQLYQRPPSGEAYPYPESAYGVMSWWDYGHWITAIARRIPNSNPFQAGAGDAGKFFTNQTETVANEMLDKLGSKYIIIDYEMATRKFYAMIRFADKEESSFFEPYYKEATQEWIEYYYPEYYYSMCTRLYNFGGEGWVPAETVVYSLVGTEIKAETVPGSVVISWKSEEIRDPVTGKTYWIKVVTDERSFATYDEAEIFLAGHPDYIMVGKNPFVSPVPLEPLEHHELIYSSDSTAIILVRGEEIIATISYVEIFEYVP